MNADQMQSVTRFANDNAPELQKAAINESIK